MKNTKMSLKLRLENMAPFETLTSNQELARKEYKNGNNLILAGSAGTGKTYLALNLAIEDVLDRETHFSKVVIIRSIVPTRDIGFLPGDESEKKLVYEAPYKGIMSKIFNIPDAWDKLKAAGDIEFMSTSFIRGITLEDCIVVIDEMQNLSFHELDSVITRLGENCKLIMSGDYYQSDLVKEKERQGLLQFIDIAVQLKRFKIIEFTWEDIVRSSFVRDYIMTKEMMNVY
jgi:predicted ribonuclease YlaK